MADKFVGVESMCSWISVWCVAYGVGTCVVAVSSAAATGYKLFQACFVFVDILVVSSVFRPIS
jgi:hypothetical protein